MPRAAELLVLALARALADDRRVLLVGDSFETLELLAGAAVRELVVVTEHADPGAPAGETAGGAPLRMRPDWKERPRSKDLIVDRDGLAPAEEVTRLLKKQGLYLTAAQAPALDALEFVAEVNAGAADALTLGTGVASGLVFAQADEVAATAYLGGASEPSPLPAIVCGVPPGTLSHTDTGALAEALAAAEAEAARLPALEDELATARAALEAARADRQTLEAARGELTELEQAYEAVRTELAERRVQDKRADAVRARFEQALADSASEVEALRARLRKLDEIGAVELDAVLADREAARVAYRRVGARLAEIMERLTDDWPTGSPPPPVTDEAAVDAWLAAVQTTGERAATARAAAAARLAESEARAAELAQRVREQYEALQVREAEQGAPAAAEAPVGEAPPEVNDLQARVDALEAALASERALRATEHAELARARQAARLAAAERERLATALLEQRRAAAQARLVQAAAEDAAYRQGAELALRDARIADLEAVLAAHARMQVLLSDSLRTAEEARDESDSGRRLADENLRILRAEFERLRQGPA